MNVNFTTPVLCFGEILWDMLPDGPQPGGAPLNVAYHLRKLGIDVSIVSRIAEDEWGIRLEKLIGEWGIRKALIQRDPTYSTSQVIAHMNNGNEVSYDIVFPVAWDFIENTPKLSSELETSTYFIFGSLAARHDITRRTLFELLEQASVKVLDINLRPPFIRRELIAALLRKADIVKFNLAELEFCQILFGGSYGKEMDQIRFIQEKFQIAEILVTKGEFGASYYRQDKVFHEAGREIKVNDTIGSGDSFLAAFVAGHYRRQDPQTLLKNAMAMGGFIATKKGGCPEYIPHDFEVFRDALLSYKAQ